MAEPELIKIAQPYKGRVSALSLSDQPQGVVLDSLDVVPFDCKTRRKRLSVRPGFETFGSGPTAGLYTLGAAYDEPGGVQLMGCSSTNLYRFTSGAFSSVGTITTTSGRAIEAVCYGRRLFIACAAPYKVYNYDADDNGTPDHTIADWTASEGTIPPGCTMIALHGPRIALAGDPNDPNIVHFGRSDEPLDWDASAEDSGAAISIPFPATVTAIFPHTRNCFVVGFANGMSIVRGNPGATNAMVEQFEFEVGPINSTAWCKGDRGYTYIMTHNGLYRLAPGCGDPPEEVSRGLIPDSLIGLDGATTKAVLVYDEANRIVHIYTEGAITQHWLFDVDGGSFWKITAPGTTILAAHRFGPADSETASGGLVVTAGGVKRLDSETPLGGSSEAFATLLVPLAAPGYKGLVRQVTAVFGSETDDDDGTLAIYGAESAVAAATLPTGRDASETIAGLMDNFGTWYARADGNCIAAKITQDDTSKYWTLDSLTLHVAPNGVERG